MPVFLRIMNMGVGDRTTATGEGEEAGKKKAGNGAVPPAW